MKLQLPRPGDIWIQPYKDVAPTLWDIVYKNTTAYYTMFRFPNPEPHKIGTDLFRYMINYKWRRK